MRYHAKKVFLERACQKEEILDGVEQENILTTEVADALVHTLTPVAWVEGKARYNWSNKVINIRNGQDLQE